jgi:hypothetical protein
VRQLHGELGVVEAAFTMVACGAASRVRLVGLACSERLLERAGRTAGHAGVQATPPSRSGDGGVVELDEERPSDAAA